MDKTYLLSKISVLNKNKILSDIEAQKILKIINLYDKYDLEKVDTFITHLVMCINRHNDNKLIDEMDENIVKDLTNNSLFATSEYMLTEIMKILEIHFNIQEIPYLHLHIMNII